MAKLPKTRFLKRTSEAIGPAAGIAEFSALLSLWRLSINRARIPQACELAEQCVALAQYGHDPALLQEAHRMLGESLFFHGQPVLARAHLEQGVALYDAQQGRVRA